MKNIWYGFGIYLQNFAGRTTESIPQGGLSIQKYESASQVGVRELKTFAINKPVLLIYTSRAFLNRSSTALLS